LSLYSFPTRRSSDLLIDHRPYVVIVEPAALKHADEPSPGDNRIELAQPRRLLQRQLSRDGHRVGRIVNILDGATGDTPLDSRFRSEEHTSELQSRGH